MAKVKITVTSMDEVSSEDICERCTNIPSFFTEIKINNFNKVMKLCTSCTRLLFQ